jgi:hypothetical protein
MIGTSQCFGRGVTSETLPPPNRYSKYSFSSSATNQTGFVNAFPEFLPVTVGLMLHTTVMILRARQGPLRRSQVKTRFAIVLLFSILSALNVARAQDRVQLFGGYSYIGYYYYPAYTGPWTLSSFNGWDGSGSVKLIRHVEIEGDFGRLSGPSYGPGGGYSTKETIRTYAGGPRISTSFRRASLYGHVLFGELTYKTKQTQPGFPVFISSDTTFAMTIGGGTDLWLTRHFGARLVQIDYLRNNNSVPGYFAHPGQHRNFRILTGVMFRFRR